MTLQITPGMSAETKGVRGTDTDTNPGRRRFLIAGTAVIAGLATLLRPEPAAADCLGSPCCALATCTLCDYQVSRDRFICPAGYNQTLWTCVESGTGYLVWCGECSAGPSCYEGPWYCSTWFYN